MSDLISRQDANDTVEELNRKINDGWEFGTICTSDVLRRINTLPSAEKTGKWEHEEGVYGIAFCSNCEFELRMNDTNYCPNCGAKMEGGENE